MEAQRIFEKLTNQGIIDFRLSVFALLNRCDLLLLEYQAIDNPRIVINRETSKIMKTTVYTLKAFSPHLRVKN